MIKTSRNDIIWNYSANLLNIAVSILVLPLILKLLSPTELGLWYVFISISSLVLLIDFGFSSTLMRHITYAVSGASEIREIGVPSQDLEGPNYPLVKAIVLASKSIYKLLSRIAAVFLVAAGFFYVVGILKITEPTFIIAWAIYAFGSYLNLMTSFWIPILKGSGAIKAANKVIIFSKSSYLIFAALGLALHGGLITLTLAYLLSVILNWVWARYELHLHLGEAYLKSEPSDTYTEKKVFKIVWPNAKRMGLVNLGSWFTNKASTLISSYFLGLEITGQLGVSIQLFTVVGNVANLLFNSYLPELASTRTNNNDARFKQLFARSIVVQWVLTLVGNASVIFILPFLLGLIHVSTKLLPFEWLLILGIILFLEQNHSTFAALITLSNKIPFVKSSLVSGFSIIIISTLLMYLGYGVGALILTQGLIQLSFNNWYWPYVVVKENQFLEIKLKV